MTNEEFSNEFDILYNNVMSNAAPGLNEYEKSVFLTKAQDEIVKAYFDKSTNKSQQGFDDTERRQIDFSMLMRLVKAEEGTTDISIHSGSNVKHYQKPTDILLYINEVLTVTRNEETINLTVVPINYLDYNRLMSKPFKRPLKNQAWRLIIDSSDTSIVEIVPGPNDTISSYIIRYIARPQPIILTDFTSEGVSLDGINTKQECKLDPILHHEILQRAVELAKAAYTGDLNSQVALGVSSETNMGMLTR